MKKHLLVSMLVLSLFFNLQVSAHYCDCFPGGPATSWQNKYITISNTDPVFQEGSGQYWFEFDIKLHTTSDKDGGCIAVGSDGQQFPKDCTSSSGCHLDESTCSSSTHPKIYNFVGRFTDCSKQVDGQGSFVSCGTDLSYADHFESDPYETTLASTVDDLFMNDIQIIVDPDADYGIYNLDFELTWDPDIYAAPEKGACNTNWNFNDQTGYEPDVSGSYPCGSFIKEVKKQYELNLCLFECSNDAHCSDYCVDGVLYSGGSCEAFPSPCTSGGVCNYQTTTCNSGCNSEGTACETGSCTPDCSGKVCGDDGCGGSCGTCGANAECSSGSCGCSSGFADCDSSWANGCEININSDDANCGACGASCGLHAACSSGSCSCDSDYLDCDSSWADGCEVNKLTDDSNCGSCGTICTGDEHCSAGTCTSGCVPDCSGKVCGDDGCGGSCGTCSNDHGPTSCSSGQCVPDCDSGWGDCDSDAQNGCETDLTTTSNCGSCGTACAAGEFCNGGSCESTCVPDCSGKDCGDDGCGGSCGTCNFGFGCNDGVCECIPDCDGRQCGSDACGGSCGTCSDFEICNANGICELDCIDDCSVKGATLCAGEVLQVCGYFDDDPCLEYDYINCTMTGEICQDGGCVAESCESAGCVDDDSCCPSSCDFTNDNDCELDCETLSGSQCDAQPGCSWCGLGGTCMNDEDIECTTKSCNEDGEYCTDNCQYRNCFGTSSSCFCSDGECQSCDSGQFCDESECRILVIGNDEDDDSSGSSDSSGTDGCVGRACNRVKPATDPIISDRRREPVVSTTAPSSGSTRVKHTVTDAKPTEPVNMTKHEEKGAADDSDNFMIYVMIALIVVAASVVIVMFASGRRPKEPVPTLQQPDVSAAFGTTPPGMGGFGSDQTNSDVASSVQQMRSLGYTDDQIRQSLYAKGIDQAEVERYLRGI